MSYIYSVDYDDFLPRGLAQAMAGALGQDHWIYGKWLISARSWSDAHEAMRVHGCHAGGVIITTVPTFNDFTASLLASGLLPEGSVAVVSGWDESPVIKAVPTIDDYQRIVPAGVLIGHQHLNSFIPA